jgi:hypothetical protein
MTNAELKSAIRAVAALPDDDQAEAATLLLDFVTHRTGDSLLSESQRAEVERRLAAPETKWVDQEDVFAEIDRLLAGQ